MPKIVRLEPSQLEFIVQKGQTILEAALLNRVNLEYSCSNGQCGQCKAILLAGDVTANNCSKDSELNEREILTCCSYPNSDLALHATYFPELRDIERKTLPVKVDQFILLNENVLSITFRFSPTAKFDFLPGQFIDLSWNGQKRSYSIANANLVGHKIDLHVKKVEGGLFSEHLFNELKVNQLFRLHGPLGSFFIRESNSPLIFMCTGTGFAPIKAMIEHLIASSSQKQIFIYWGAQLLQDLYSDLPLQWSQKHSNIHFIPVLSREQNIKTGLDNLNSLKGKYIQDEIVKRHNNLQSYEVYACGSAQMIHDAQTTLIKHGLDPEKFYSDAFLPSN